MEALDVGSGRLYFVRLEYNADGDVRPIGETSWERPPGFLLRREMCQEMSNALTSKSSAPAAESDEVFLARVRQRFPPPATPPPTELEIQSLRQRLAEAEARASNSSQPATKPPPMLADANQRPSWKRGASAKFVGMQAQVPPPPQWALAAVGGSTAPPPTLAAGGGAWQSSGYLPVQPVASGSRRFSGAI